MFIFKEPEENTSKDVHSIIIYTFLCMKSGKLDICLLKNTQNMLSLDVCWCPRGGSVEFCTGWFSEEDYTRDLPRIV